MKNVDPETLASFQYRAHRNAVEKGFWDPPVSIMEKVALIHGELSELLEALRDNPKALCGKTWMLSGQPLLLRCQDEELADVVLRVLDLAEHQGVDCGALVGAMLRPDRASGLIGMLHARTAILGEALQRDSAGDIQLAFADLLSGVEHVAEILGVDLWQVTQEKHRYNLQRPTKHGKAF